MWLIDVHPPFHTPLMQSGVDHLPFDMLLSCLLHAHRHSTNFAP